MTLAITAGILVAGAVYLLLKPEMLRIILGFVLLSHAANLIIMAAGNSSRREEPFGTFTDLTHAADPLPQAFVLTAIVISFSITVLMLVLAVTGKKDDNTSVNPSSDVDDTAPHATDHAPHPTDDAAATTARSEVTPAATTTQEPTP